MPFCHNLPLPYGARRIRITFELRVVQVMLLPPRLNRPYPHYDGPTTQNYSKDLKGQYLILQEWSATSFAKDSKWLMLLSIASIAL